MAGHVIGANRRALVRHGTPLARAIADAIGRMGDADLDEAERAGIAAIEARRSDLVNNDSLVDGYESLTIRDATALASKNPREARLLFRIVQAVRPQTALELGANMGISGAYEALALQLNGTGRLVSLEGSSGRTVVARETLAPYGNAEIRIGRFDKTLAPTLTELGTVQYAFIDGHHKREPTLAYFEQILPHVRPAGVLLFDDIHHNPGMDEAWKVIAADARISFACDLGRIGLCLIDGEDVSRRVRGTSPPADPAVRLSRGWQRVVRTVSSRVRRRR